MALHPDDDTDSLADVTASEQRVGRTVTESGDSSRASSTADTASASSPRRRLRPGDRLGRYVIEQLLGEGGMGVVYRARDDNLQRSVAVKLLRSPAAASANARQRLLREARSMARLSAHPNIVTVYEADTIEGCDYIAMEYIDGTNVAEWLDAHRGDWSRVVAVFAEAGLGLAAAHAAGLVHRDFKPHNVLIDRDGRVVVTDFGLVRLADGPGGVATGAAGGVSADSALTAASRVLGTPAYMAPEQHRGADVDERADQYSFCAALYQGVYGELPFRGATVDELRAAIEAGELAETPSHTRVPRRLRRILMRGLATQPDARFASMSALLTEMHKLGRSRWRALAGFAAVVAITVSVAFVVDRGRHTDGARSETAAIIMRPLPDAPDQRAAVERVRAMLAQARAMHRRGELDGALDTAQRALADARTLDYPALMAETLFRIGEVWRIRLQPEQAIRAYEEAELIASEIGDREILARARAILALLATNPSRTTSKQRQNRIRLARIAIRDYHEGVELSAYIAITEAIQAYFDGTPDVAFDLLARSRATMERHKVWRMVAFLAMTELRFRLDAGHTRAAHAVVEPLFAALSAQDGRLEYELACQVKLLIAEHRPVFDGYPQTAPHLRRAERDCPTTAQELLSSQTPVDTRVVAGRVLDSAGRPAAGARVSIGAVMPGDGERALVGVAAVSPGFAQTTADDHGGFTLSGVPVAARILVAETAGERSFPRVLDRDGDIRDAAISLRPVGRLSGRVSLDNLRPHRQLEVVVIPLATGLQTEASLAVDVDESGGYRFDRLATGAYRALLVAEDRATFDELEIVFLAEIVRVDIAPGEAVRLDFGHRRGGSSGVHVLVRNRYQQALDAAHVVLMPYAELFADRQSMDQRRLSAPAGHRVGSAARIDDRRLADIDGAHADDLHHTFTGLTSGPWVMCAITWVRRDILAAVHHAYLGYPEHGDLSCTRVDLGATPSTPTVIIEATPPRRR